jgi:Ca-activated chloride channel family protein
VTTDFLAPGRLWLLLIPAILLGVHLGASAWRRRATVRFTRLEVLDQVAPTRPGWRRHVVAGIQLLGLVLAVIAVARPVDRDLERVRTEGRILLLIDVSLSMMAEDIAPDRLTAAQAAAREFVAEVDEGVEIGVLSFSGVVTVEAQPTLDRDRVVRAIDDLELAESTAIGEALAAGTALLEDRADVDAAEGEGRDPEDDRPIGILVVLSDGETTVGRPTEEGAAIAAEAGVPAYTISFGTVRGSIADPETGQLIPVPVRPEPLADVAETTGGTAFVAQTGTELAEAYDQIRDSLGETLGEEIEIITELTWRWALASLLTLSIAWLLGAWWRRGVVCPAEPDPVSRSASGAARSRRPGPCRPG